MCTTPGTCRESIPINHDTAVKGWFYQLQCDRSVIRGGLANQQAVIASVWVCRQQMIWIWKGDYCDSCGIFVTGNSYKKVNMAALSRSLDLQSMGVFHRLNPLVGFSSNFHFSVYMLTIKIWCHLVFRGIAEDDLSNVIIFNSSVTP